MNMNNAQPKRRSIRLLIVVGFLLVAAAVGGGSYLAYTSVSTLTSNLKEAVKPNQQLQDLQTVINAINTAESSVRAFAITQDEQALASYYEVISNIDEQLDELANSSQQEARISRISVLIEEKFVLMDSIIDVISLGEGPSAFDQLYAKILAESSRRPRRTTRKKRPPRTIDSVSMGIRDPRQNLPTLSVDSVSTERIEEGNLSEEDDKKKRPNIFKRIFGKKKTELSSPPDTITTTEVADIDPVPVEKAEAKLRPKPIQSPPRRTGTNNTDPFANIRQTAQKISQAEAESLRQQTEQVRRLTRQDQLVMGQVMEQLSKLEVEQQLIARSKAIKGEQEAEKTNKTISLFALGVIIVVLFLLIVIFRDSNRNRKMQSSLRRAKSQAEMLAQAKEDFLSNMSHEIRTPMNAIVGFNEQLTETTLDIRQQSFVKNVSRAADHLLDLINSILDYSKLESGNFQLEYRSFRIMDVLEEAEITFKPMADKKGLKIGLDLRSEIPDVLLGDPLRLRQMLFNLLNNAIKFTEKGSVMLRVKAEQIAKDTYHFHFTIADTGIGIPADQQNKIFVDFEQADSGITRRFGGTGLGLSITKKLTELHGGIIELESEEGVGTEITLVLPFILGDPMDIKSSIKIRPSSYRALNGKRVLVADDEPYNRMLVETILAKWDVQADFAENGQLALDLMHTAAYDFILMDFQMPVMDGLTSIREIRLRSQWDHIPIVGLTATSLPSEIEKGINLGMNAHLLKPFKAYELYNLMTSLLKVSAPEKAEKIKIEPSDLTQEIEPAMGVDSSRPYDLKELFELGNNESAFVKRMLQLFATNTRSHLSSMRKAANHSDWSSVGATAHKIIPPTRHLGMLDLVDRLKSIELDAQANKGHDTMAERVRAVGVELDMVIDAVEEDIGSL